MSRPDGFPGIVPGARASTIGAEAPEEVGCRKKWSLRTIEVGETAGGHTGLRHHGRLFRALLEPAYITKRLVQVFRVFLNSWPPSPTQVRLSCSDRY
jgi:hypothetical protein